MSLSEDRRFNSWKEIATFLDRDIRTVWRWEKERGLPVHRIPGDGRRAVFAYQREIEAWLKSSEHLSNNGKSNNNSLAELGQGDREKKWRGSVVGWALGSICVLGIAAAILAHWDRHPTRIQRVSAIHASTTMSIIIDGKGFGPPPKTILITPDSGGVDTFADSYLTSIRIDNLGEGPHHWIAGRAGPLNYCDITLKLASWTDNRIVLAGFAGPLGTSCKDQYQIAPGDKLQIIVWGPQNRCGPGGPSQCPEEIKVGRVATYDTFVLSSEDVNVPSCR